MLYHGNIIYIVKINRINSIKFKLFFTWEYGIKFLIHPKDSLLNGLWISFNLARPYIVLPHPLIIC